MTILTREERHTAYFPEVTPGVPRRQLCSCYVGRDCDTRNNQLHFGGDPDHDLDEGIFKGFSIYYCDSYTDSHELRGVRTFRVLSSDYSPAC